jgi:hypothetical protein
MGYMLYKRNVLEIYRINRVNKYEGNKPKHSTQREINALPAMVGVQCYHDGLE